MYQLQNITISHSIDPTGNLTVHVTISHPPTYSSAINLDDEPETRIVESMPPCQPSLLPNRRLQFKSPQPFSLHIADKITAKHAAIL